MTNPKFKVGDTVWCRVLNPSEQQSKLERVRVVSINNNLVVMKSICGEYKNWLIQQSEDNIFTTEEEAREANH